MLLHKCLYAAFPLVTMEKLCMLLSNANSPMCGMYSKPLFEDTAPALILFLPYEFFAFPGTFSSI